MRLRLPPPLALLCVSVYAQLPGLDGVGTLTGPSPNIPERPIACDVGSEPQTIRSEGFAELLGDLVITCRGFLQPNPRNRLSYPPLTPETAPVTVPTITLSVTLSAPLASREVSPPSALLETLLFIDDPTIPGIGGPPSPRQQNPCAGPNGICSQLFAHDGLFDTAANRPGPLNDNLATAAASNSTGPPMNVFQGTKQGTLTVIFLNVPISSFDTRGNPRLTARFNELRSRGGGVYQGQEILVPFVKTFRIKNLRVAVPNGSGPSGQVSALVSVVSAQGQIRLNQSTTVLGFIQQSLQFRQRNTTDTETNPDVRFTTGLAVNRNLARDASDASGFTGHFLAQFQELTATAFRTRGAGPGVGDQDDPRTNYGTESGFYSSSFPTTNGLRYAGLADYGTRLRFVVRSIPNNVRVFVSAAGVRGTSPTAGAYGVVANPTGDSPGIISFPILPSAAPLWPGVNPIINGRFISGAPLPRFSFASGSAQGIYLMQRSGDSAFMTWEVYSASHQQIEKINFLVAAAFNANNTVGTGATTISGGYGPVDVPSSPGLEGIGQQPIPRTEEGIFDPGFIIGPAQTNLLFPFITSQAGYDTTITISNTSLSSIQGIQLFDPILLDFGIGPQDGNCTINFFGAIGINEAPPPPIQTGLIGAGKTFTFSLARGSQGQFGVIPAVENFQGYALVQCNFRFAHGYAYLSNTRAPGVSHGYLGLAMDLNLGRTGWISESLGK